MTYQAGIEPALRTAADSQPAPAGIALSAAPASVGTGGSTVLTTTVQDFSWRPLSTVALTIQLPTGWTAKPLSAPVRTVAGGATATTTWRVTAPATPPPPRTRA